MHVHLAWRSLLEWQAVGFKNIQWRRGSKQCRRNWRYRRHRRRRPWIGRSNQTKFNVKPTATTTASSPDQPGKEITKAIRNAKLTRWRRTWEIGNPDESPRGWRKQGGPIQKRLAKPRSEERMKLWSFIPNIYSIRPFSFILLNCIWAILVILSKLLSSHRQYGISFIPLSEWSSVHIFSCFLASFIKDAMIFWINCEGVDPAMLPSYRQFPNHNF